MVMRGQYLERPTIVQLEALALEALYHRGERAPSVLVIPPPATGGSPMELPVVAEMAWALHRASRPTLRFNPRGLGASQGAPGSPDDSLTDASAALGQLRDSTGESPAALLAIGEGWRTAVRLARQDGEVTALAFVAPSSVLREALEEGLLPPALVLFPEGGGWDGESTALIRLSEVAGTDAQFLRGLSLFGQAVNRFLDALPSRPA
jgi:pimeloyl-ACP methyl ester carboxylesterase